MLKKIAENIYKLYFKKFGSNCYFLIYDKKVLIDTSSFENRNELLDDLKTLNIEPKDIDIVLLTHSHYDHIENIDLFKDAEIYISIKEKLSRNIKNKFKDVSKLKLDFVKAIPTPGHTAGSTSFFLPKEKILFSGDTLFEFGIGSTDFPESRPEKIPNSLKKLYDLKYKILCAGH